VTPASALRRLRSWPSSVPGGSLATWKTRVPPSPTQRPLKTLLAPISFLVSAISWGGSFLATSSLLSPPLGEEADRIGLPPRAALGVLMRSLSMVGAMGGYLPSVVRTGRAGCAEPCAPGTGPRRGTWPVGAQATTDRGVGDLLAGPACSCPLLIR